MRSAGETVDDIRENAKLRKEQGYRKVKMPVSIQIGMSCRG